MASMRTRTRLCWPRPPRRDGPPRGRAGGDASHTNPCELNLDQEAGEDCGHNRTGCLLCRVLFVISRESLFVRQTGPILSANDGQGFWYGIVSRPAPRIPFLVWRNPPSR